MQTIAADLSRIHLTIQRLLDADLLLKEETAPLLACVEAARDSPEAEHSDAIRSLVECLASLCDRLEDLNSPDARAVVVSLESSLTTTPIPAGQVGDPAR